MTWLLLLFAVTSTKPALANAATSQPFTPLVARPMSADYTMLLNHSMFIRGHQALDTHRPGVVAPPASMPAATTEPSLEKPEDALVFNGVTVANGTGLAFIEDLTSNTVQTVEVGQSIAQGKITDITLDTLSYTNASHTVQLHIGQNLSGNDAFSSSAAPTSAPSDVEGDSVEARMRHKRQQELLGH